MATHVIRSSRVVSIGECMVELSRGSDGRFGLAYGGDTFNTAVYLARAGLAVDYVTRLGDDPYSAGILDLARSEGIGTSLIAVVTGRMPGLYLIETSGGERAFWYWRDRAPAREVFDQPEPGSVAAAMADAAPLDSAGLAHHLSKLGLEDALSLVARANTHRSDRFAEPDAPPEVAAAGFRHLLALQRRRTLERELKEAESTYFRDESEAALDELTAIRRLLDDALALDPDLVRETG